MNINIITPNENMWLTQASIAENDIRIFSKRVLNPTSEWAEWNDEQKVNWEKAHNIEE